MADRKQEVAGLTRALATARQEERAAANRVEVVVQELRSAGVSWPYIAAILGVSRQAARQRYGRGELL